MNSDSVRLALSGPPLVITSMKTRFFAVSVTAKTTTTRMVGLSRGIVTYRNRWGMEAPSTLAASYRSSGIPWSPARKITMQSGMIRHDVEMMKAGTTESVEVSQLIGSKPRGWKIAELTSPYGWKRNCQRIGTTMIGMMAGKNSKTLRARRAATLARPLSAPCAGRAVTDGGLA